MILLETYEIDKDIYDMIYGDLASQHDNDLIKLVEEALGIKLFYWQKMYLVTGAYRHSGLSLAQHLRFLLDIDKQSYPIDYRYPRNKREEQTKFELHQLKEKLDEAGIKTINIWFTDEDKEKWLEEKHRKETSEQLKKMS